ncbi:MAG: hypothetical protein ACI91F_003318 [Candidatus Binatia bacterium]
MLKVLRIDGPVSSQRKLRHGSTMHGVQFLAPQLRALPTAYFGRVTGIGMVLSLQPETRPMRIGVVGLGVGTLSAYARAGDMLRFYEMEPAVIRIARDDGYFDYVGSSAGEIEITLGDARVSLARERVAGTRQQFDHLIIDAFSSDAIPVHLLTREAFAQYSEAMAPGALLVFHITNRYFALAPIVLRMGADLGMTGLVVRNESIPRVMSMGSEWVILSQDRGLLIALERAMASQYKKSGIAPERLRTRLSAVSENAEIPVWTDDYSDLVGTLRSVE